MSAVTTVANACVLPCKGAEEICVEADQLYNIGPVQICKACFTLQASQKSHPQGVEDAVAVVASLPIKVFNKTIQATAIDAVLAAYGLTQANLRQIQGANCIF